MYGLDRLRKRHQIRLFENKGLAGAKAIPELLYPGTIGLEWHFPQENAAFHDFRKGMVILESL
jgi:hypothetical protein